MYATCEKEELCAQDDLLLCYSAVEHQAKNRVLDTHT